MKYHIRQTEPARKECRKRARQLRELASGPLSGLAGSESVWRAAAFFAQAEGIEAALGDVFWLASKTQHPSRDQVEILFSRAKGTAGSGNVELDSIRKQAYREALAEIFAGLHPKGLRMPG